MSLQRRSGPRKAQSSVEYISTFAIALLILVVVIAVVAYFVYSSSGSTHTASSCTISAQINCVQVAMASNSSATEAFLVFTNQLGQQMKFSANSITFFSGSSNSSYQGTCLPATAQPGATVTCNATLSGYTPSVGSQQEPRFVLHYSECVGNSCSSLSTYGSGTTYVSPPASLLRVQLVTNPSSSMGTIYFNGASYTSNSYVYVLKGANYSVHISPSTGSVFSGWSEQGGVSLKNSSSESTTLTATSAGTITATLSSTCYSLALSASPSGAASAPTASASTHGCPSGEYAAGEHVAVTAQAPDTGYIFSSWSGTASNSLTSFNITMPASAATETAGYNAIQCYALTLTASPAGAAGNPTATTSLKQGCPAGEYAAGYNVTITASSGYATTTYYVLHSWSGMATKTWAFNDYGYNTILSFNAVMPANTANEQANYLPYGPTLFITNTGSNTFSYAYANLTSGGAYAQYWNNNGIGSYYSTIAVGLTNSTSSPGIPASGPSALLVTGASPVAVLNTATNTVSFISTYTVPNTNTYSWHTTNVVSVGPDPVSIAYIPGLINFNQTSVQISAQQQHTAAYGSEDQLHCTAALPTCQFYVADHGSDTVTMLQAATISSPTTYVVNTITVGSNPISVVPSQDGNFLFVANSGSATVSVINPTNNVVVNTIALGFDPINMGISSNGEDLYVQGQSSVGVIAVPETCPLPPGSGFCQSTFAYAPYLKATYTVDSGQQAMAIAPDSSKVYVASAAAAQVINTTTGAISTIGNIPSGADIMSLAAIDNGTVYMADSSQNEVLLANVSTDQVVNTIAVGSDPTLLHPSCQYMLDVADTGSGSVDIINTATRMVAGVITGLQSPGPMEDEVDPSTASSPVVSPPYFSLLGNVCGVN